LTELIVALDVPDLGAACRVLDRLCPLVRSFKVGSQLFTAAGPQAVREVQSRGGRVFLDLKYCDIPHTVERAAVAAAKLGVWMFTVHACGGLDMMRRATVGARSSSRTPPLVVGVTALTSADAETLRQVGVSEEPGEYALRLARLAREAGLDGVVCSVHEVQTVKEACGAGFLTVVPGVRAGEVPGDDQARRGSLEEAARAGADYVVVGRPVLQAADPLPVVRAALEVIGSRRRG